MIITEAEVRAALGIASSVSDQERAFLTLVVPAACSAVNRHLGYNPEQALHTELLPRSEISGGPAMQGPNTDYDYISNTSNTRAILRPYASQGRTLQLGYIPVRAVTDLRLNQAAYSGQAADPFPDTTRMTQGSDFWVEFDEPLAADPLNGLGSSGCLFSQGIWPVTPGSVKVTYRAGYSPSELRGVAEADEVAADGTVTQRCVDAGGIWRAALLAATRMFHQMVVFSKSSRTGWNQGPINSETMGAYSYTQGAAPGVADMTKALPPEAVLLLEPFLNWGARLR